MITRYPKSVKLSSHKNEILNFFDYYFSHARTALKYGLDIYKLNYKSILVPEYICYEYTDILKQLNINIVFYKLNDDLSPDYKYILNLLNKDIKAITIVHYFGIPQDIKKIKEFCSLHKLILIDRIVARRLHEFNLTFQRSNC